MSYALQILAAAVMLLLFAAAPSPAQRLIHDFYAYADSVAEHPPFKSELGVLCRAKLMDHHLSFVGFAASRTILFVTFTKDSLADPVMEVSQTVTFSEGSPSLGKVKTWAYVFDRNRDGRIDYAAVAGGAAPFMDKDFPETYPKDKGQYLKSHLEYFISKCRIIFNHWADDDFDDTLDAIIQADMDLERDWVRRRIIARSTKFDGSFDEVWGFRDWTRELDTIPHTPKEVPVMSVGEGPKFIDWEMLGVRSMFMRLMNQGLGQCGKGSYRLLRPGATDLE